MAEAIITQTSPNLQGQARVDLQKEDFDAQVWFKGVDVYHEKALRCPCKARGGENSTNCLNCLGSGWLFIQKTETKMVVQSMNLRTQYKDWSEETVGNVTVTSLAKDGIAYMDRITVQKALSRFSEVVYPIQSKGKFIAKTVYEIVSLEEAFLFLDEALPLVKLELGTDITISSNIIELSRDIYDQYGPKGMSLRYVHNPAFHVIDVTREVMITDRQDKRTGITETQNMPVSSVARRAHYIFDSFHVYRNNDNQTQLIDNSYTDASSC